MKIAARNKDGETIKAADRSNQNNTLKDAKMPRRAEGTAVRVV